jgi:hypothetical protein
LRLVKACLNPDGRVLIAIENRLGLKYLNGAVEDHTDNYFLGLNGYEGNDSVRTFSRSELSTLLTDGGFNGYKFYYPYPDYKMPSEIFTDESINAYGYGAPYPNLNKRNYGLYSEQKVADSLARESILASFANSFLVEACANELSDKNEILYAKINSLRRDKYQIMTLITREDGVKYACKMPVTKSAEEHIRHTSTTSELGVKTIQNLKAETVGNGCRYPFLQANSLSKLIEKLLAQGKGEEIKTALKDFFSLLENKAENTTFYTDKFAEIFGSTAYNKALPCISPANIDLICDNIFLTDDTYTIIDTEWCFDMPVPLGFIIWRCLNELYYKMPELEALVPKAEMLALFHIEDEMRGIFINWAVYFADKYVGNNYLSRFVVPINQLSLLDAYSNSFGKRNVTTSCYFDLGNGFSEETKVFKDFELDAYGNFEVSFNVPEGARAVRWDVAEERYFKCKLNTSETTFTADNAVQLDGFDVFYTSDPHYTVTNYSDTLTISGVLVELATNEVYNELESRCADLTDNLRLNKQLVEEKNRTIEENKATIAYQAKELEDRTASLNLATQISGLDKRYILTCEDRLKNYHKNQVTLNLAVEDYQQQLAVQNARYEALTRSRAWRFMSLIWRFSSALRRILKR